MSRISEIKERRALYDKEINKPIGGSVMEIHDNGSDMKQFVRFYPEDVDSLLSKLEAAEKALEKILSEEGYKLPAKHVAPIYREIAITALNDIRS